MLPVSTYNASPSVTRPGNNTCLQIGRVSIGLAREWDGYTRISSGFETQEQFPDIQVSLNWSDTLRPSTDKPSFDSGAVWKLFRNGSDCVFDFTTLVLGAAPYKRMRVDRDFRRAQITLNRELLQSRRPFDPLEYPIDELLVTNYLASGIGVEVHGCGLIDRETGGHLFLGHSGAGKSTTARLWQSIRNPEILSDDRIILRLDHDGLWMYGTPWHGEAAFASANQARLKRIFILQHGAQNLIRPLTKAAAVGEVFARSFPPFHSASGLEHSLEFLKRALDTAPCYEFQFTPDAHAVEEALKFHD